MQTWYIDFGGRRRHASPEALQAAARARGAELVSEVDVESAIRARRAQLARAGVEPVHVAWEGRLGSIELRHAAAGGEPLQLHLRLDSGETHSWRTHAQPAEARSSEALSACFRIPFATILPLGYHSLEIESAAGTYETLIIAAPRRAHVESERSWGVFAPLYAVRSERDWGVGDFTDLERLGAWAGALGAGYISTLPLLATFLDAPFEPSPYAPASRLFWNELFLDPDSVPGRDGAASNELQDERSACRAGELLDYRRTAALKRRAASEAAHDFFNSRAVGSAEFTRFLGAHVEAVQYARFRAVGERQRSGWSAWPERLRRGEIRAGDYDEDDARYHLFAQFEADRQLSGMTSRLRERGIRLYLDLPLGVHAEGYDVWRKPQLFALGTSAGAPPDALFSGGQSWGFPPLDPDALRRDHYRYLIDSLRHLLRHAGMLRLDHVMALRRLYWIPPGFTAKEGVYVRYPAAEWLAVLTLESRRHQAAIIGEDLGTVPREVRAAMDRHGLQRMYVVQFEASADAPRPTPPIPEPVIASLNTHDMPPFAAYWSSEDIDDQLSLGLIDDEGCRAKKRARAKTRERIAADLGLPPRAARPNGAPHALHGLLEHLAASDARALLIGIEDLWLENRPQNVPGTASERPNWRRRLRRSLEELTRDRNLAATLGIIERRRHGKE